MILACVAGVQRVGGWGGGGELNWRAKRDRWDLDPSQIPTIMYSSCANHAIESCLENSVRITAMISKEKPGDQCHVLSNPRSIVSFFLPVYM